MKKLICTLIILAVFITACGKIEASSTQFPTTIPTETPTNTSTPTETATNTPTPMATEIILPSPTQTVTQTSFFASFVEKCKGSGKYASCIYVNDNFALRLIWGDGENISGKMGTAMLFDYAWNQGKTVGIIAHDYAEGKNISKLTTGTLIYLISPDGTIRNYMVDSIDIWKNAGRWKSFTSSDKTKHLTSIDLEDLYYLGGDDFKKMVLQTCINGDEGVMFVTAFRIENQHINKLNGAQ